MNDRDETTLGENTNRIQQLSISVVRLLFGLNENIIWVLLLFIHAAGHDHMSTCVYTAVKRHDRQMTKTNRCDWSSYQSCHHSCMPVSLHSKKWRQQKGNIETKRIAYHSVCCVLFVCWCVLSTHTYTAVVNTERVTYISLGHRWFSKRTIVKVLTSLRPNEQKPSSSIALAACGRRNTKISKQIFDVYHRITTTTEPLFCSYSSLLLLLVVRLYTGVCVCVCLFTIYCTLQVIRCFFPLFRPFSIATFDLFSKFLK